MPYQITLIPGDGIGPESSRRPCLPGVEPRFSVDMVIVRENTEGETRTRDLGGTASTGDFTRAVIAEMRRT
jgi:isocitrate/isopropylmalate dehydrogenase